jgi:hypothetical protein
MIERTRSVISGIWYVCWHDIAGKFLPKDVVMMLEMVRYIETCSSDSK